MFTLNCKGRLLPIDRPLVMGILNVTPDSFYEGSRSGSIDDLLIAAEKMIVDGADILDVGGQSTRPDSKQVDAAEELRRVLPAIDAIHKRFKEQIISVDTFYGRVANEAVDAGASIVNDISAGALDPALHAIVAQLSVPYVLMHMRGTPQTMQQNPVYENVSLEVFDDLNKKLHDLEKAGIHDVIIDPGFGFGKSAEHNFCLLKDLEFFTQLQRPLLVGLSRKATIYKSLGITAGEALNGSTVMHTIALLNGASILRVHDVKEAREAVTLVGMYRRL